MEQKSLKPCPFCGTETEYLDWGVTLSLPNDLYYVQCPGCGIRVVMEHIETWNRRASNADS